MTQRRRIEYEPDTGLGHVLGALATYQLAAQRGELAAAAAAARAAERSLQQLVDAALTEASGQSSSRQLAEEIDMAPATVTYRIRRHRQRPEEGQQ